MPKPSVGVPVHYRSYGTPGGEYAPACRAAVVTEVREGSDAVGLAVLNPSGMFFHSLADGGCAHDEGQIYGGTWHWPERLDA